MPHTATRGGCAGALLTPAVKQSPILARTYDLVRWLIPLTVKFPRQQRFVLAESLQRTVLLIPGAADRGRVQRASRCRTCKQADVTLTKLRFYLRLCRDLELMSLGQYAHVTRMVSEVGRLLGGWQKAVTEKPRP